MQARLSHKQNSDGTHLVILYYLMMCLIYVILVTLLVLRSGMYKVELFLCMLLIISVPALSFTLH
jgi:hypothetical protein